MSQSQSGSVKNILQLLLSVSLLVVAGWIFLNRQYVFDQIALSRFTPTSEIESLVKDTSMTDRAVSYFYASHPEVQVAQAFNDSCPAEGEESIILGCYTRGRIYIYDVTDERLDGIKEVTAAHEMLHAAYDRLSNKEKDRINTLLSEEFSQIKDQRVQKLIKLYEKSQPDELLNEMHSIFATEVSALSPELEEYYGSYFTDRNVIVAHSQKYESVFSGLKDRQAAIIAELKLLSEVIDARSKELSTENSKLSKDIAVYNKRATTPGGFSSQSVADQERSELLQRRSELQQERDEILALIEQAKRLEEEYKQLLGELESLNRIIDSTPDEVPTIQSVEE